MRVLCRATLLLFCLMSAAMWASAQEKLVPADQQQKDSDARPDSTVLKPLKTTKAVYPPQARIEGIQGRVVLKVEVSEIGKVEHVDVLSGDPVLADAAVRACKKWVFEPFIKNGAPVRVNAELPFDFFFSNKVMNKGVSEDRTTMSAEEGTVAGARDRSKRLNLAQGISQGLLVRQIAPVYPQIARQRGIQGTVILSAVIAKTGAIQELKAISGPKELVPAAIGAVQQWVYKPYVLNGEPVEVETVITVNFRLGI